MSAAPTSSNFWARVQKHFLALDLPARTFLAMAVLAIIVLAGYLSFVPPKENLIYLLGGQEFNSVQLQAVCQALEAEGLTGFRVDGSRLKVPTEKVALYANALTKREALPAGFYTALDKAAEQSTWWSSSAQDDRRWELAKQKSLAQAIEQIPDVETASVFIDRSQPRGLRSPGEVRASVTIKPKSGRELSPVCIRKIRSIVSGSVASLLPESVAVVDLSGKALLELGGDGTTSGDLLMRVKEFEEHYTRKVRNVLAFLPEILVTVSVELDTTRQRRTERVLLPVETDFPSAESRKPEPIVQPEVAANTAVDLEGNSQSQAATEPRPTQQQTWEELVPLAPKSITVAVAVPQDIVATLPTGPTVEATANSWTAQIKDHVASALPAGVTAIINVASFPRKTAPATALGSTGVAAFRKAWGPWTVASVLAGVLALTLVMSSVRWQQNRVRRSASTRSFAGGQPASQTPMPRSGEPDERTRELIRIEHGPAWRTRGPHLIQAKISGFEDLRRLAPASLQAVLGAVDSRLWAPALRGASRELCDRVLAHMPARAAMLLREEIEFPGPVRLGDVETAQQEILEVVRRLDHTGDLVLEGREELLHE